MEVGCERRATEAQQRDGPLWVREADGPGETTVVLTQGRTSQAEGTAYAKTQRRRGMAQERGQQVGGLVERVPEEALCPTTGTLCAASRGASEVNRQGGHAHSLVFRRLSGPPSAGQIGRVSLKTDPFI